jgi:DNA modification methylase
VALDRAPPPEWWQGDAHNLDNLLPSGMLWDMVFTSPPYYDLEVYRGGERDGSEKGSYPEFMEWLAGVYRACVLRLNENRFLMLKVGEVRDRRGAYYGFLHDTIRAICNLGLHYYNEAVLLTPIGSMPFRAGMHFRAGRKLEKGHQNVLVFYKGDLTAIPEHFPKEVQMGLGENDADAGAAGA